jgi:hypothetical protein
MRGDIAGIGATTIISFLEVIRQVTVVLYSFLVDIRVLYYCWGHLCKFRALFFINKSHSMQVVDICIVSMEDHIHTAPVNTKTVFVAVPGFGVS